MRVQWSVPRSARVKWLLACWLTGLLAACSTAPPPASPGAPTPTAPTPAPATPGEPAPPPRAEEPPPAPALPSLAVVAERWETVRRPEEDLGGLAVWTGAGDRPWLLATAEATDRLLVFDAGNGELLRDFGGSGDGEGRFRHPGGLWVADDLAFVVEAGNARVQVLRLPGLSTVGFVDLGEGARPSGLTVTAGGGGVYDLYVGDDAVTLDAAGVPVAPLGRRVLHFEVRVRDGGAGDGMVATLLAGSAGGEVAEVAALPAPFAAVPQGRVALYPCADGGGYWLAAEPAGERTLFLLFDRRDLRLVGRFSGELTAHSDGVWLTPVATPDFPAGALYAVHDDRSVTAFDWRDVAATLGLRDDCAVDGGS